MLSKDETSLRLLLFHVEWMFAWHRDAKAKQQKNVFKMKCFDTFIKCWMLLPSSDDLTSGWQRKARIIFLLQKQGHRLTAYHSFAGSGIEMTLGQKSKYQRKVHGEKVFSLQLWEQCMAFYEILNLSMIFLLLFLKLHWNKNLASLNTTHIS